MPEEKNIQELGSMKDILQGAIQREESSYRFYLEAKARSRTPQRRRFSRRWPTKNWLTNKS